MNSRVVLLIPAYKPSAGLVEMLRNISRDPGYANIESVVVVDDGSGDRYRSIFDEAGALPKVTVVPHAINLGKGAALKTGFNHALTRWPNAGIVTADADGQHAVADILRVADHLSRNPADLVLGVRGFDADVPLRSRVGNNLTKAVFRTLTSLRLTDTQTGLRGWPRAHCLEALRVPLNGYDFELECLINAKSVNGRAVREVPIQTIYLDENRSSHFNPLRDSMRVYYVFLRYCGSGILAAIVDSLTFYLTYQATAHLAWSQFAGRALAVMVAFMVARNLVFRSHAGVFTSLAKYLGLVIAMGIVSYSLIQFLHVRMNWPVLVAKIVAEGMLFLGNFAVQRDFIFAKR